MKWALTLAALLLLSGCASDLCTSGQVYEQAQTAAPLKAPGGLQVPAPDPSMQIPDVAPGTPDFVYTAKGKNGDDARRCLAVPPPLPDRDTSGPRAALRD